MSSPSESHDSIFGAEYRVLTIGVISVMSIIAFEAMGVITAMPTAARDLDGLDLYAWGSTAVMAAALFATAAAGGWADRKGPVPPLAAGLGGFMIGTVVCGIAPTMQVMLLGRALQGLGFGAAIVAIYVVIGRAFPEDMRPRVFTGLSGAWIVPGIAGPLLAGWITEVFGWRWVFFGVLLLIIPVSAVLLPKLHSLHPEAITSSDQQAIPAACARPARRHRSGRSASCWPDAQPRGHPARDHRHGFARVHDAETVAARHHSRRSRSADSRAYPRHLCRRVLRRRVVRSLDVGA